MPERECIWIGIEVLCYSVGIRFASVGRLSSQMALNLLCTEFFQAAPLQKGQLLYKNLSGEGPHVLWKCIFTVHRALFEYGNWI